MNTKLLGRWGETLAAQYLKEKGYKISGLSYKTRLGEIDIIAEDKKHVVFVEVKLRKSDAFAAGREYVDKNKIRRIISTAQLWLSDKDTEKQPRFDVLEIYAPQGAETKNPTINHIENAFGEENGYFGF